jgi:hypothetical protein
MMKKRRRRSRMEMLEGGRETLVSIYAIFYLSS